MLLDLKDVESHVFSGGEVHVKLPVEVLTNKEEEQGSLQVIYKDGNFHNLTTLSEIREKLK
jgi:hypothetical protein